MTNENGTVFCFVNGNIKVQFVDVRTAVKRLM